MAVTKAEAKSAVIELRAKFPNVGPYKFAKMVENGGNALPEGRTAHDVDLSYTAYSGFGGSEGCFYPILNVIRRFDANVKAGKVSLIPAAVTEEKPAVAARRGCV